MTGSAIIGGLLVPAGLGALCGGLGLFADPHRAVRVLNRFALYVAFPALILAGLVRPGSELPGEVGFWLVHPVSLGIVLLGLAAVSGRIRPHGGTLALTLSFGNVAYLGLPVLEAVFGEEALGLGALAVSEHVVLSLLIGPALLLRWGSDQPVPWATLVGRVARQPLLWAPVLGVAIRILGVGDTVAPLVAPVGKAAGPVALFLLGLYLHTERTRLMAIGAADAAHVVAKIIVFPVITGGIGWAAVTMDWLSLEAWAIWTVLSAMPAAITTFALAHELEVGSETVARTVVASTIGCVLTVPLVIALVLPQLVP